MTETANPGASRAGRPGADLALPPRLPAPLPPAFGGRRRDTPRLSTERPAFPGDSTQYHGAFPSKPPRGILAWPESARVIWPHGHMLTRPQCREVPHSASAPGPGAPAGQRHPPPVPGSARQCHTTPPARVTWPHAHLPTRSRVIGSVTECHPPRTQLRVGHTGLPAWCRLSSRSVSAAAIWSSAPDGTRPSPSDTRRARDHRTRRRRSFARGHRRPQPQALRPALERRLACQLARWQAPCPHLPPNATREIAVTWALTRELPASLPPKQAGPFFSRFLGRFGQIALHHTRNGLR